MALWRSDWTVQDALGRAVPNALVYWVQQPATTNVVPPSPLVAVALTATGATSVANNPQTTNGFGQTFAYMVGGVYTVVEVWNGVVQGIYADQAIGVQSGVGTVSSVGLTVPNGFSVAGSPVVTTGTLAITAGSVGQNYVAVGPALGGAGVWTFRPLVAADLPTSTGVYIGNTGGSSGVAFPQQASVTGGSSTVNITAGAVNTGMIGWNAIIYSEALDETQTNFNYLFGTVTAVNSATQFVVNGNLTVTEQCTAILFPSTQNNSTDISTAISSAVYGKQMVIATQQVYVYSQGFNLGQYCQGIQGLGTDQVFFVPSTATAVTSNGVFVVNQQSNYQRLTGFTLVLGAANPSIDQIALSAWAVAAGTITFTVSNGVTASVGSNYRVRGFTSSAAESAALNDSIFTVLSSSSTQFTAATLLNNQTTLVDNGACSRDINGIIQTSQTQAATGTAKGLWIQDVEVCYAPGDNIILSDPYTAILIQVKTHHGGGCGRALVSNGGESSGACTFIGCRSYRNWMAGYYGYQEIDSVYEGCDGAMNGNDMWLQKSKGIVLNGLDFEVTLNNSPAFSGYGYHFVDCGPIVLNGCEFIYGNLSSTTSTPFQFDGTCTNFTMNSCVIDATSSPTAPTYAFNISSAASTGSINDFSFGPLSASAYNCASASVKLFRQNNYISQLNTTGGAFFAGTVVGNLSYAAEAQGALQAALNNDSVVSLGAVPTTINTETKTGTTFFAVKGHIGNASVTGTPAILADVVAIGGATAGTLNYGFYEVGTAPNLLNGTLILNHAAVSQSTVGYVSYGSTTATTATAGAVQAVPATVLGYLIAYVGTTQVKIPYFAV